MRLMVQYTLLALVLVLAWRRGGMPERTAAGILIGALLLDRAFHAAFRESIFHQVDIWHLCLDVAMLAGFFLLALYADRKWPMWLAALQVISTTAHVLRAIRPDMLDVIYPIIARGPYYGQLIVLLIAMSIPPNLRSKAR